jgi:hypothetical protein
MGRRRKKSGSGNVLGTPRRLRDDVVNIHDAFLNTSLQRSRMLRSSMEGVDSPQDFFMSDRGRFERTYIAFLAVLIEAWCSPAAQTVRDTIASRVPTQPVDQLLARERRFGVLDRIRSIRGYMFHRDERQYWDVGRVAVAQLHRAHEEIYSAFSAMFLAFFRSASAGEFNLNPA